MMRSYLTDSNLPEIYWDFVVCLRTVSRAMGVAGSTEQRAPGSKTEGKNENRPNVWCLNLIYAKRAVARPPNGLIQYPTASESRLYLYLFIYFFIYYYYFILYGKRSFSVTTPYARPTRVNTERLAERETLLQRLGSELNRPIQDSGGNSIIRTG